MKLFVCSDLHSYFDEFIKELEAKGFERDNPEHLLVVCGDVFDRGPGTVKMKEYLDSLSNVVLVRGNHEDLMEAMWKRGYVAGHDISNGTSRSANAILEHLEKQSGEPKMSLWDVAEYLQPFFKKFVNYFETKNYIFVHGWIPCIDYEEKKKPWHLRTKEEYKYIPEWRSSTEEAWADARWINGIEMGYEKKIIEPGKTIVCGHWHCSLGHALKAQGTDNEITEFEDDACFEPFKEEGILAIDACTAHTGKVNIVVLEDDLLED